MYRVGQKFNFFAVETFVCGNGRVKVVMTKVVYGKLSLVKELAPKVHKEVFINTIEAGDEMRFPVANRSFSSIPAVGAWRDILGFNFSFIAKESLQFGAVLIVQHLELGYMAQVLEKRICSTISGYEFWSLATL